MLHAGKKERELSLSPGPWRVKTKPVQVPGSEIKSDCFYSFSCSILLLPGDKVWLVTVQVTSVVLLSSCITLFKTEMVCYKKNYSYTLQLRQSILFTGSHLVCSTGHIKKTGANKKAEDGLLHVSCCCCYLTDFSA